MLQPCEYLAKIDFASIRTVLPCFAQTCTQRIFLDVLPFFSVAFSHSSHETLFTFWGNWLRVADCTFLGTVDSTVPICRIGVCRLYPIDSLALCKAFKETVLLYFVWNWLGRLVCNSDLAATCDSDWHAHAFRASCRIFCDLGVTGTQTVTIDCDATVPVAGNRICRTCRRVDCIGMGTLMVHLGISLGTVSLESVAAAGRASDCGLDRRLWSVFSADLF